MLELGYSTLNLREHIVDLDQQIPLLNGTSTSYINFDNAASTPPLRKVLDKVNNFMGWYSSIHRGSGFKSRLATEVWVSKISRLLPLTVVKTSFSGKPSRSKKK